MTLLQNREINQVLSAINKMKIFENSNKFGLSKKIIENSFIELKPRNDRYTIVNRYKENIDYRKKIIKEFFEIIDKEYKIC